MDQFGLCFLFRSIFIKLLAKRGRVDWVESRPKSLFNANNCLNHLIKDLDYYCDSNFVFVTITNHSLFIKYDKDGQTSISRSTQPNPDRFDLLPKLTHFNPLPNPTILRPLIKPKWILNRCM